VESVARLASGEVALLRDVVARRCPELLPVVDRIGTGTLSEFDRNALRRAVVDEMCEHLAPGARADRRDLELSDLLLQLSSA
jgi:hypothetical protein